MRESERVFIVCEKLFSNRINMTTTSIQQIQSILKANWYRFVQCKCTKITTRKYKIIDDILYSKQSVDRSDSLTSHLIWEYKYDWCQVCTL